MLERREDVVQRLVGGLDLLVDFATLGEYGLEPAPVDGPCERSGRRRPAWEALAGARRGRCEPTQAPRRRSARSRRRWVRSSGAEMPEGAAAAVREPVTRS
jgi:hypothetical protein